MKSYRIFIYVFGICAMAWFLPWLYSLAFPSAVSDPFVAYSPVADAFVVSENGETPSIRVVGSDREYSKEERDSLLPQIYFTQLAAREKLPDTIAGKEVSLPIFKHSQWVFSSIPRDINKVQPDWHLMMESMPKRYELEDPVEAFSLSGGKARFVVMAGNSLNENRSRRFTKVFDEKGFAYPPKHFSANITSRKPYDDGYLITDAEGALYHVKMRAGTPYVANTGMSDTKCAFILENADRRLLGLAFDSHDSVCVIERDGYKVIPLHIVIDPHKRRISVMANIFNIVLRSRGDDGADWWAVDADTYGLLGHYRYEYPESTAEKVGRWIFPFRISFTDIDDCYAYPRITDVSCKALALGSILAAALFISGMRRKRIPAACAVCALIFGVYFFIIKILKV